MMLCCGILIAKNYKTMTKENTTAYLMIVQDEAFVNISREVLYDFVTLKWINLCKP